MDARFILAGLVALCSAYAIPAGAQDDSAAVVCSTPLTAPPTRLSWPHYFSTASNPDKAVDHETLEALVNQHARTWPSNVREPIEAALDAFESTDPASRLESASLRLDKDIGLDLTATQFAFRNRTFQLELPMDAADALCSSEQAPARIEAAYVVLLMERALGAVVAEGASLTAAQIGNLEELYDKYLFEGFPMFPWEAWANGKLLATDKIAGGPPRNAMVLLHPGAGVVSSIESDSRTDAGATLSVEPFGWIWYSDDYSKWWGVSLLAVLPSDRNTGGGIALNYNNFKLGVTWHDDDGAEHDGLGIFLGVDFMQFLGEKQRKYEGYKKELDEALRSARGARNNEPPSTP